METLTGVYATIIMTVGTIAAAAVLLAGVAWAFKTVVANFVEAMWHIRVKRVFQGMQDDIADLKERVFKLERPVKRRVEVGK